MKVRARSPVGQALWLGCLLGSLMVGCFAQAGTVKAQACPVGEPNPVPAQSILLSEAVPVQPSTGVEADIFLSIERIVDVASNSQVILSSTQDGEGWLSTDDLVQVRTGPNGCGSGIFGMRAAPRSCRSLLRTSRTCSSRARTW